MLTHCLDQTTATALKEAEAEATELAGEVKEAEARLREELQTAAEAAQAMQQAQLEAAAQTAQVI